MPPFFRDPIHRGLRLIRDGHDAGHNERSCGAIKLPVQPRSCVEVRPLYSSSMAQEGGFGRFDNLKDKMVVVREQLKLLSPMVCHNGLATKDGTWGKCEFSIHESKTIKRHACCGRLGPRTWVAPRKHAQR